MSPGMFPGHPAKETVRFRASSICRFPFAGRCFAPPYPAPRDNPGNGGMGEVWLEWHNAGVLRSCAANRKQRTHPPLKGLPWAVHAARRISGARYHTNTRLRALAFWETQDLSAIAGPGRSPPWWGVGQSPGVILFAHHKNPSKNISMTDSRWFAKRL